MLLVKVCDEVGRRPIRHPGRTGPQRERHCAHEYACFRAIARLGSQVIERYRWMPTEALLGPV